VNRASLAPSLLVLALLTSPGCGDTGGTSDRPGQDRTNPFVGDGGFGDLEMEEEFQMDLTGNGVPEVVTVAIQGHHPRALEIELTVVGAGDLVLHGSAWSSAEYPEFGRPQGADAPTWVQAEWVREHLEELLGDDSLRPLAPGETDPLSVRRDLRLQEWRIERGFPAGALPSEDEEPQVSAIEIPDQEVREVIGSLTGRPALGYLAGGTYRTIVWSPELERFVQVTGCC
jgi:hypothetical protein